MASAVIGSSPSNVLLYRVKKGVDGSGAERIKYAGSLQGGTKYSAHRSVSEPAVVIWHGCAHRQVSGHSE